MQKKNREQMCRKWKCLQISKKNARFCVCCRIFWNCVRKKQKNCTKKLLMLLSAIAADHDRLLSVRWTFKYPINFNQSKFTELIPRPARACQDPPMYLRLRMGRQSGKSTPLPTTVMSYGKNKLRPEYWFSIPKNK